MFQQSCHSWWAKQSRAFLKCFTAYSSINPLCVSDTNAQGRQGDMKNCLVSYLLLIVGHMIWGIWDPFVIYQAKVKLRLVDLKNNSTCNYTYLWSFLNKILHSQYLQTKIAHYIQFLIFLIQYSGYDNATNSLWYWWYYCTWLFS